MFLVKIISLQILNTSIALNILHKAYLYKSKIKQILVFNKLYLKICYKTKNFLFIINEVKKRK